MRTVLLMALVACVVGCNPTEEHNTTHGKVFMLVSETYFPLMKLEATEFMTEYDKTKVEMATTTTRGAIVELLNDSVHCICVDRELNAEERKVAEQTGVKIATVRIGKDALVLLVNDRSGLKTISRKTLEGILDGSITNWRKVPGSKLSGRLELVMTGRNSGSYELVQRRFFKLSKELALAKIGETERQIVQYIAATETAFGIVSLAAVVDRPKGTHALAVESSDSTTALEYIEPSQANVYNQLYPLNYSLYLYISEKELGVGSGFSTFVMTLPGQQIIQDYGLAPEIVPSRIIQLRSE